MKIVIDTNVLIAAIAPRSPYHIIFKYLLQGKYKMLISTEIYFEYTEILALKSRASNLEYFEKFIVESESVIVIEPTTKWKSIISDQDDNKFVDCAIEGNADMIVTNDAHFSVLSKLDPPLIRVLSADKFMEMLLSDF